MFLLLIGCCKKKIPPKSDHKFYRFVIVTEAGPMGKKIDWIETNKFKWKLNDSQTNRKHWNSILYTELFGFLHENSIEALLERESNIRKQLAMHFIL